MNYLQKIREVIEVFTETEGENVFELQVKPELTRLGLLDLRNQTVAEYSRGYWFARGLWEGLKNRVAV